MNKEKQKILIAEACVKTMNCCRCQKKAQIFKYGAPFCSEECAEACGDFALDCGQQSIPNYSNDLNAMCEAESTLEEDLFEEKYVVELGRLFYPKGHGPWKWRECPACIVKANAEQRAEAFLKTIGKWEDE